MLLFYWRLFWLKEFYREKFVYSWGALTVDSILFGCLFIGYAVAGYYAARPAGGNQVINHFCCFRQMMFGLTD